MASTTYTQACEDLLAQRSVCEVKAKRKAAEKEANRESRLKAKEDHQHQVQQRAQAREVKRRERECVEAKKHAVGGGRRHCNARCEVNIYAPAVPSTLSGAPTPNVTLPSAQLWPSNAQINPMSLRANPP